MLWITSFRSCHCPQPLYEIHKVWQNISNRVRSRPNPSYFKNLFFFLS